MITWEEDFLEPNCSDLKLDGKLFARVEKRGDRWFAYDAGSSDAFTVELTKEAAQARASRRLTRALQAESE